MSKGTVLILVGPEYEDLEVWYPKLRLEEAGYETPIAGMGDSSYRGKHGYPCPVDGHIGDYPADSLVGILAPGGWAPDKLRRDRDVLDRVRQLHESGKLVATICHGPWILISAGIVRGRRLTSTVGIRDDLVNAGAHWVDEPAVIDGNIVSARVPKDLPAFGAAMLSALADQARSDGRNRGKSQGAAHESVADEAMSADSQRPSAKSGRRRYPLSSEVSTIRQSGTAQDLSDDAFTDLPR